MTSGVPRCTGCCALPSSSAVQAAIRELAAGRAVWTPGDLARLEELWRQWREARAREQLTTAA